MNEEEVYQYWLETGRYPDGFRHCMLTIEVKEMDGVLDDATLWMLHGSTELTPINGKRVRKAADAAHSAFYHELFDNLDKP